MKTTDVRHELKDLAIRQQDIADACGINRQDVALLLDEKRIALVHDTARKLIQAKKRRIINEMKGEE